MKDKKEGGGEKSLRRRWIRKKRRRRRWRWRRSKKWRFFDPFDVDREESVSLGKANPMGFGLKGVYLKARVYTDF